MKKIIEPDALQLEFSSLFPTLVLASSSPNRKALLEKGGSKVITFKPEINEERINLSPEDALLSIAEEKLETYLTSSSFNPTLPAIAADTMVYIDDKLLGKSKTREEAKETLKFLSGKEQEVISAVGVFLPPMKISIFLDKAKVKFKKLSEKEIEEYLDKDEWIGAAGSYRLQKTGYELVDKIDGDWTCVVGLPLKAIIEVTLHNVQNQS